MLNDPVFQNNAPITHPCCKNLFKYTGWALTFIIDTETAQRRRTTTATPTSTLHSGDWAGDTASRRGGYYRWVVHVEVIFFLVAILLEMLSILLQVKCSILRHRQSEYYCLVNTTIGAFHYASHLYANKRRVVYTPSISVATNLNQDIYINKCCRSSPQKDSREHRYLCRLLSQAAWRAALACEPQAWPHLHSFPSHCLNRRWVVARSLPTILSQQTWRRWTKPVGSVRKICWNEHVTLYVHFYEFGCIYFIKSFLLVESLFCFRRLHCQAWLTSVFLRWG